MSQEPAQPAPTPKPAPDVTDQLSDVFDTPLTSVAGFIMGVYAASSNARWQLSISNQLAQISQKLDDILRALADLKVYIHQELEDSVATQWSTQIDSTRIIVDGLMSSDTISDPDRARLPELLTLQQLATLNLTNYKVYGFSHYGELTVGYVTTIALMKLLSIPVREVQTFCLNVAPFFDAACNGSVANSFESEWNDCYNAREALTNTISARMNQWFTYNARDVPDPNDLTGTLTVPDYWEARANGYVALDGFELGGVDESDSLDHRYPDYPDGFVDDIGTNIQRYADQRTAVENRGSTIEGISYTCKEIADYIYIFVGQLAAQAGDAGLPLSKDISNRIATAIDNETGDPSPPTDATEP